jgi:RNA-binding protein Musashi
MKFGRVIDATLMMDKDTGRPRGFGFVTFDGEDAVDRTLAQPLDIHGKPIEVKRAEPRGNMEEKGAGGKFNKRDRFNPRGDHGDNFQQGGDQNQFQGGVAQGAQNTNGMSQAQMAQYWFKMQEYFRNMQQAMAAQSQAQAGMQMGMPQQMNPAMMQQMMQMQNQPRMMSPGGTPMGPNGGMSPGMMQQMQAQMGGQMMPQQPQQGFGGQQPPQGPQAAMMGRSPSGGPAQPAFNAMEQQMFEQQKYERQQQARMQQSQFAAQQGMGGSAWDGMYDDVPAPNMAPTGPAGGRGNFGGGRGGRGGGQKHQQSAPPAGPANAPINAPTGPKNATRPGANYRGGGRQRGNNRGFQPY